MQTCMFTEVRSLMSEYVMTVGLCVCEGSVGTRGQRISFSTLYSLQILPFRISALHTLP